MMQDVWDLGCSPAGCSELLHSVDWVWGTCSSQLWCSCCVGRVGYRVFVQPNCGVTSALGRQGTQGARFGSVVVQGGRNTPTGARRLEEGHQK